MNIVGNIVGEVETIESQNKNGEVLKVKSFSVVSKDDEVNKIYSNCQLMEIKVIFQRILSEDTLQSCLIR